MIIHDILGNIIPSCPQKNWMFPLGSPQFGRSVLQVPPEVVFANVSRRIAIQGEEVIGASPRTQGTILAGVNA